MDSDWKTQMSPPLALAVLAALTPDEHRVRIADENVEKVRLDDSPDLVGITVKVDTMQRASRLATVYRKRNVPVVFGGIHPTACPEECARHADTVVVGEAEAIWPRLLQDAQAGRLEQTYRNDGPVDIQSVPVPRLGLLRQDRYLFTNTMRISRGCPWRCDFCYNSSDNVDNRYRTKSIPRILREIDALRIDHVMFIDDNFIGDPHFTRRLIPELKRRDLTWHAAVSADIGRHDDILDMMGESRCKSLFIGFESVNADSLKCCHKTQNRSGRYDETIRKIHERGIMVNASLAFGFDEDDPGVFPATLDWLTRNRVATMTAHILTPYPGTRLYRKLQAEGRIIDHDLSHYNTAHAVFRPARMTANELEQGYRWMYRRFYSWESILRRCPQDRSQRLAYLQFALLYRKFGKAACALGKVFGMRNVAKLARLVAYPRRTIREWLRAPLPSPMETAVLRRNKVGA